MGQLAPPVGGDQVLAELHNLPIADRILPLGMPRHVELVDTGFPESDVPARIEQVTIGVERLQSVRQRVGHPPYQPVQINAEQWLVPKRSIPRPRRHRRARTGGPRAAACAWPLVRRSGRRAGSRIVDIAHDLPGPVPGQEPFADQRIRCRERDGRGEACSRPGSARCPWSAAGSSSDESGSAPVQASRPPYSA